MVDSIYRHLTFLSGPAPAPRPRPQKSTVVLERWNDLEGWTPITRRKFSPRLAAQMVAESPEKYRVKE